MDNNKQILHFSHIYYREVNPSGFRVNLILKPTEEYLVEWCKKSSTEHQEIIYYTDPKKYERWVEGLEIIRCTKQEGDIGVPIDIISDVEDPQQKGYTQNDRQCLTFIEKFNVYQFRNYVLNNPISRSTLDVISFLQQNNTNLYSRFSWESELRSAIETLYLYLD